MFGINNSNKSEEELKKEAEEQAAEEARVAKEEKAAKEKEAEERLKKEREDKKECLLRIPATGEEVVYSKEVHGEDYREIAEETAKKYDGIVE